MRGLGLASLGLVSCVRAAPAPVRAVPVVALVGVELIAMNDEGIASEQTVIVSGGTITDVGPGLVVPEGARVIEGAGRFLVPGLSDMHVHLPEEPAQIDEFVAWSLASGITSIRGMQGAPSHLVWREQNAGRDVPGLRLAGPPIAEELSVEQARERVREQRAAGYDEIKVLGGLDRAAYEALLDEAHSLGIRVSGHLPEEISITDAIEAGQASVEHLMGYEQALDLDAVAAQLRPAGVWNCPTLDYFELALVDDAAAVRGRAGLERVPADVLEAELNERQSPPSDEAVAKMERRRQIVRALARADAPLLVGSDAPGALSVPGAAYYEELRALVGAGLSPYEVLRAATVSAAQYRGHEGRIVSGARADLVLLDGNPLETIEPLAHPAGVMIGGQWLAREELDRLLAGEAPL